MQIKTDHPNDDPRLPSFLHPTLRDMQEDLQRAYDCWCMLRGIKETYLPKEVDEPPEAYRARVGRSVFTDFFRSGIEAFAGVLSRFALTSPPSSFQAAENNIDLEGNSIKAFMMTADAMVLRDGGIWLWAEMPPGRPGNSADEAAQGRRPYLVARTRSLGLNWRTQVIDGIEVLKRVTFLEMEEQESEQFGVTYAPRYRVINGGEWYLFAIEPNASNELDMRQVDNGFFEDSNGDPLPFPPVVWYSADDHGFGQGMPPLRQVAEHSIEHFQRRSDLREKDHRCNMPVGVAIGRTPPAPGQPRRALTIGPNTVIDLDKGGSFTFAEPSATSLAFTQAQIQHVEALIQQQTLSFLYGSSATKTATQAGLEAAQTQAGVTKLAERKASVMQQLMAIWCLYTGEELDPGAGIEMSSTIYDRPLGPQDLAQLQTMAGGVEVISQESVVEEVQRAGLNRATTSVAEEMKRIRRERRLMGAKVPGRNDLGDMPDVETPLDEVQPQE